MDRPILEQETWSLIKWLFATISFLALALARFLFGDVNKKIDQNKKDLEKLDMKIDTFIKEMKEESAFQKHLIRKMAVKNRKTKQREKKNDGKKMQ